MSSYFLQIESSLDNARLSTAKHCLHQLGDNIYDQFLIRQTDSVFVGFRYLDAEGINDKNCQDLSKDSRYWIILDGCIDNLRTLADDSKLPQDFTAAQSVAALYKADDTSFLEKLQGRFSLVIVELNTQLVVLYRSRLGQFPLYYHSCPERIIAASEERAIATHPDVPSQPNAGMLAPWFSLSSSFPAGQTAFTAIKELLPGECLVWKKGNVKQWRSPLLLGQSKIRYQTDQEYADHYLELMQRMVARCLPASGDVGVMLSSGIDSAPAAAIAAQKLKKQGRSLDAYSWSLPKFDVADESSQIAQVASFANIPLQMIDASTCWPLYNRENLHITANSPLSNAFQGLKDTVLEAVSADGCKVILNGWFGDRLFMFRRQHLLVEALRSGQAGLAAGELIYWMQQKGWKGTLASLKNRMPAGLNIQAEKRVPEKTWLTEFSREHLVTEDWPPEAEAHRYPDHFRSVTGPGNFQFGGNNKASFGRFGIEQRNLYQDEELIDFMQSIPLTQLTRLGQTKFIARNAAKGLIPENIRLQSRVGVLSEFYHYGLWIKERRWLQERLFDTQCSWDEYVERDWLTAQFKKVHPPETASLVAWQCLTYELWLEKVKDLERQKLALL